MTTGRGGRRLDGDEEGEKEQEKKRIDPFAHIKRIEFKLFGDVTR